MSHRRAWAAFGLAPILLCMHLSAIAAEKCLTCHEGIEPIGKGPVMSSLPCTACHRGDGNAADAAAAHKDMYANPSDLRVIQQTCGGCHIEEVRNAFTGMHATSAGVISGTRYDAGAQDRHSKYANYAVTALKTGRPGTVEAFAQVPSYEPGKRQGAGNTPADDYLRNQCLRCHIWSDGHQRDGDWRASGCAACHMVYSDAGTYEGGDKAIRKDQKDRPRIHQMTSKVPEYQCIHCHNRGARTGVSFIGTMESDGYGTPWKPDGGKQGKLHGKHYNHLQGDVHYERGMTCIDCHTKNEMHGDGYLYEKKHYAVEVRCVSCHGTPTSEPTLETAFGNKLTNVEKRGKKYVLRAKLTDKQHVVPVLKGAQLSEEGHTAMVAISKHMDKLECYACHARWAPQCYGCHAKQDVAKASGDWINTKKTDDPSKAGRKENREKTAFAWDESRSYLRWKTPVLGINYKGKVSPFIPGCQVIFSQVKGKQTLVSNHAFTTVDSTSGLAQNAVQPHTISKESRTCADCHMSRKALGLGSGFYDIKDNFPDGPPPVEFELEQIVTADGKQLQATNHVGARPLNKEEIEHTRRIGTCIACHAGDRVKIAGNAPTDELHTKAIRSMVK